MPTHVAAEVANVGLFVNMVLLSVAIVHLWPPLATSQTFI